MILYEWLEKLKLVCIFLICAQSLIHFRGGGAYGKYLRLLVSIMLLVQLMEPFGLMLGILENGEIERSMKTMEGKWSQMSGQVYGLEEEAEDIWQMFLENVVWQQEE